MQKFLIARSDQWYLAFPDVTLTASGKLVCVYNQCTHHHNREVTQIMQVVSTDRGRTWSDPAPLSERLVMSEGGWHWNCPRISRLSDGRLVAVCDKLRGKGADHGDMDQQTNVYWLSDDEGASWRGPHETPVFGIVPDQLIELQRGPHAGRWLLSAHSRFGLATGVICAQRTWWSDDHGRSWHGPATIAQSADYWFCEGSTLELPDGTLVCFLRENSGLGYDAFKTISTDAGASWSAPVKFPLPGCHRPVSGMLNNGQVLITHRLRQGGKGWSWGAQNFLAGLTDVESCLATERQQAHARILPIDYDRSPAADTGYSGWVQFDDGEIYIVNYIVDDHHPRAHIRGYSLGLDDFILHPIGG
jgi:hypothetical protein